MIRGGRMKALFVATVQSHIAQFHLKAIELLKQNGYEVHVAAKDNLAEKNGLQLKNVDKIYNVPFSRSPFSLKNMSAYCALKKIIVQGEYDLIHCNTPVGGILTRLAARKEKGKVLYTAHGFHFYKGAPLKNWILYYPIEKVMTRYTDGLITINDEDYEFAKKNFKCPIYRTHGVGVNTEKYKKITKEEIDILRKDMGLSNNTIILCTGELNKNKNQKTIIIAMQKVVQKIPSAVLLLAGNGPEKNSLQNIIRNLKLEENVKLIGYHTDLEKYVQMCDLVVSASIREGLPLNIVEGMHCSKPIVASKNRGHCELLKDEDNGYLVSPRDTDSFADKIILLCLQPEIRLKLGEKSYLKSLHYTDQFVLKELRGIYFN